MTPGEQFWVDAGNHWLNDRFTLNPESRCIDVGGYLGNWTEYITKRFDCYVDVYEPVPSYAEGLAHQFAYNPKVHVFNSGLEAFTGETGLAFMDEGSSMYHGGFDADNAMHVHVTDVSAAVQRLGFVDLMAINAEGAEYNILSRLITTREIARVRELIVQFHAFYPDAENLRNTIRAMLETTHRETFCYPFCWEGWKIR